MEPAEPIVWGEDLDRRFAASGDPTPDDVTRVPAGTKLETQQDHDEFIESWLMNIAATDS